MAKALERFGLIQCKIAPTPERVGHEEDAGGDAPAKDAQRYMELVGTLLYAAICTRPDIARAVMVLTRHMKEPLRRHEYAAERVLRYLAGTKEVGLVFGNSATHVSGEAEVLAYADADWANDRDDRKSVSGWLLSSWGCGGLVSQETEDCGTINV